MNTIRILIADDEALERRALHKIIQEMSIPSIQIYEAENGREVLERVQQVKIDIVLLDIKMPGLDGISVAKEIQIISQTTAIIFITAFSEFDYAREAIRIGVKEYLVKPVSQEKVQETLETVLHSIQSKQKEQDTSTLVEQLLYKELETAIGRESIINEQVETFIALRGIRFVQSCCIAIKLEMNHSTNHRTIKDNELQKARIIIKNALEVHLGTTITGQLCNDNIFYSILFLSSQWTYVQLLHAFTQIIHHIQIELGIQMLVTATEWNYRDLTTVFKTMKHYISLVNHQHPVLIINADTDMALDNAKGKIAKIIEYLQEHLAQNITLAEAAQIVGLSPYHISHLFKIHQGESYIQVYTKLKIEAAKQLLCENRYTIKEICRLLGFKDQGYFSRVFKKVTGVNPQDFLKQYDNQ
ncbi:response regulator transcription factor [Gracilinema caldarium]|uniref:Two component transcriptional regulator, AraC family n=1 Tax=Gracilinema caldarium (strain ATCC 51460 / DSM 7334 / H1) TaxID=744872 RepID=F8EZK5_GRAC1|nr:response regulator [Gracilinema caldarium]AEJ20729.1 two component transcriptional regulator, AraC family [Gracilinema caldarium DSM 7334]